MSVNEILKNKLSIDRRSKVVAESKTELIYPKKKSYNKN
jgi:hypothetical protein